jgi:membrane associated rhomboid family serine protease
MLRKVVSRSVVNQLWQEARSEGHAQRRSCPACRRRMTEVPVRAGRRTELLDVCQGCHFVWFDPREFERLPRRPAQAPQTDVTRDDTAEMRRLPLKAREAVAMARLETLKAEQGKQDTGETEPDHWSDVLVAFLGVPVEYNYEGLKGRPWLTWLLVAVIAAISGLAFRNLRPVIEAWGMIPAEFTRHFALTFITSFFLHADLFHLLGNLYFLWVFGDNTEDVLGKGRYLLLIALATLAGDVAHILSDPGSTIPTIGASGGISGVLAYYCLRFPHATVGLFVHYHWVRVPVWVMFGLWVLYQCFLAYMQRAGVSNVAAFAHLGGAAVGVLFWLLTRASLARAEN